MVVPLVIYDTSDSWRFDIPLCEDCYRKAETDFNAAMLVADARMKPLLDDLDASTRLTAEDFNITINAT